jgi:hypothetical protein
MININLLPEDLRKEESSFSKMTLRFKEQGKLFRNLAIAALLTLICVHAILFLIGSRSSAAFKTLTQKNDELLPGKREYETLAAEAGIMSKKTKSIDALMANRFSWAKKLNDLSDAMTQGIWLTGISYEEKPSNISVQVKVPNNIPGKKEIVKTETQMTNLKYLNISGYASSMGEQGTALIGKFIKSMKDRSDFFSDFSEINLESIKAEKFMDQEVMNFKITCLFKAQG